MFFFTEASRSVSSHLLHGRSVVLEGPPGSGRTSVLDAARELVSSRGMRVLNADAALAGPGVPGQVLEQFGVTRPASSTRAEWLLTLRKALVSPDVVLAIDNADLMDPLSAQFLDSLEGQTRSVAVFLAEAAPARRWPTVLIEIAPLTLGQVGDLVTEALGAPAAVPLIARIATKSGGNPELVQAIVGAALIESSITRAEDTWVLSADTLWSDHLRPVIERRLRGCSEDEIVLLRTLSLQGPSTTTSVPVESDDPVFHRLLRRRLLRPVVETHGPRPVYVWPPLIADMFRRDSHAYDEVESALPSLDEFADAGTDTAAIGRLFQQSAEQRAPVLFAAWEADPTPGRASTYMRTAIGARSQRAAIDLVLRETSRVSSSSEEGFLFEFLRAQWLALDEGDLPGALTVLDRYRERPEAPVAAIDAAVMLLRAFVDGVPPDFREVLASPDTDPTGMTGAVRSILEFVSGDVQAARDAVPTSTPFQAAFTSFITPLLDMFDGKVEDARATVAATRQQSLLERDRFLYVASSYVDALASLTAGRVADLQSAVNSTLSTARASLFQRPFFGATVTLGAMTAVLTRSDPNRVRSLLNEADSYVSRPGPFYGMGTDVVHVIADSWDDRAAFDRDISNCIRRRREKGYLTAAATAAIVAASGHLGPGVVAEVERLQALVQLPIYDRSFRAVSALAARDAAQLRAVLEMTVVEDTAILAQLVGAAQRQALRDQDREWSNTLLPLVRDLEMASAGSFASLRLLSDPSAPERLTAREAEIAAMATYLKNAEIASKLSISVRTVENHIASAMRKTAATDRSELSDIVLGP